MLDWFRFHVDSDNVLHSKFGDLAMDSCRIFVNLEVTVIVSKHVAFPLLL